MSEVRDLHSNGTINELIKLRQRKFKDISVQEKLSLRFGGQRNFQYSVMIHKPAVKFQAGHIIFHLKLLPDF